MKPYVRRYKERLRAMQSVYDFTGKRVIDIGCNQGHFSSAIAESAVQVWGVDSDAEAILSAQRRYSRSNLVFRYEQVTADRVLEWASADCILCLSVLHHIMASSACYSQSSPGFASAMKLLRAIRDRTDVLFLEVGSPTEIRPWAYNLPHKMGKDIKGFVTWMLIETGFERVQSIDSPVLASDPFQRYLHRKHYKLLSHHWPLRRLLRFDNRDGRPIFFAR